MLRSYIYGITIFQVRTLAPVDVSFSERLYINQRIGYQDQTALSNLSSRKR